MWWEQEPGLRVDPVVRVAYDLVDTDSNGLIDLMEFRALMRDLGYKHTTAEVEAAFDAIDTDEDGLIVVAEFAVWWTDLAMR